MVLGERLGMLLQEYAALRNEQGRRFDTIDKMTNYILLMILGICGALVTLLNAKEKPTEATSLLITVCLPIFFSPLIFGYLHNELMILRIGKYIHRAFAKEISTEAEGEVFGWDAFNAKEALHPLSLTTTLFRNMILVLPVAVPPVVAFQIFPKRFFWANALLSVDVLIFAAVLGIVCYKAIYFVHVVNLAQVPGWHTNILQFKVESEQEWKARMRSYTQRSYKVAFQFKKLLLMVAYWPMLNCAMVYWKGVHVPVWTQINLRTHSNPERFPRGESKGAITEFVSHLDIVQTALTVRVRHDGP